MSVYRTIGPLVFSSGPKNIGGHAIDALSLFNFNFYFIFFLEFKEWYMSTTPGAALGTESDSSKLSSYTTDKDVSSSVNKTDDSADVNSLEYVS